MFKESYPPSEGVTKMVFMENKSRLLEVFDVREIDGSQAQYGIIRKPYTDVGITVSIRKLKNVV